MPKILLDWKNDSAPLEVVRHLRSAGHEAFLAGGCVRDLLLGLAPKDHDIATSATPDQVRAVFKRTIPVQTELGVTMVLWGDARLEVTTYRTEGTYLDGRRPSSIGPADARLDVQRRDFTINGLLLDPETGEVHDHVGGVADLHAGILRCIRDARERFEEDHLRILRAVRFAVRFSLRIEDATWKAMTELSAKTAGLSGERIHEELSKMDSQGSFAAAMDLLTDSGIVRALSPQLDLALSDAASRDRLRQILSTRTENVGGAWVALLGLPLCRWWNEPASPGKTETVTSAQEALLERLRCSRSESDSASFAWTRWPLCWVNPPPPPSRQAPLVRDKSWPVLRHVLDRHSRAFPDDWSPITHLTRLAETIPRSVPPLGKEFLAAGIPKGPALGEAIREADRLNLDEGHSLDAALVTRIAETILGRT